MIAQCPRCGSPRQGDRAFCQVCGFDYRTAQAPTPAEPVQQPATPPPTVPPTPVTPPVPVMPPPTPAYGQPQQFGQAPQFGQQPPQFGQQPPQFGQQPPQFGQPAPQFGQQPASAYAAPQPTNCPRCNAPIYPGYQVCNSCGLDLRGQLGGPGAAPMAAAAAKKSSMPTLLVVGAVALAVAAGGLYLASQNNKNAASPKPSASTIAVASGSAEASASLVVPPDTTATPAPSKAPKSQAPATGGAGGTPTGWVSYTAPDGAWSAQFPSKPMSSNTTSGSAGATMNVTMYYSVDAASGSAYFVATMDAGSLLTTMGTDAFLELMAQSMGPAMAGQGSGTVSSTTDSTLSGHPAKTFVIQAGGGTQAVMTMSAVGPRVYMVLTTNTEAGSAYTDYFMASFKLK